MRLYEILTEKWSQKYKSSINCSHPKGFSQKAHCAGKKKHNESIEMEMTCEDCGMCQTHGSLNEIKKGEKDSNGYTRCWPGKHAEGTKTGKNGGQVRNCKPNEGVTEAGMPSSVVKNKQRYALMSDSDFAKAHKEKSDDELKAMAWRHGYGKGSSHYVNKRNNGQQGVAEGLTEEFDLIESIIDRIAEQNGVDAEAVWEDLESLTDDELYVFAVTQPVLEDWQKVNKKDKTDGMSKKAVSAYRREHPGSKLKTAVTTKPSKLKKGSKASKRRSSYCSRSAGQKKMHHIDCSKTPDKAICKARHRWNC
jgi:hypothetical protein